MQTYELLVQNRAVRGNSTDMTLVRTSVGIDQVHVLFDNAEWLDFPIRITFAQGNDVITQPLTVSTIDGSSEWVAEATVTVPYEVIDMTGPIRVTLQGTDENGRHIITAKGLPLSVEEAGDVVVGNPPTDAPSVSEWQQAYSEAREAINEMQGIINNLNNRLDQMVASVEEDVRDDAQGIVDTILATYAVPATTDSLGLVRVGDGLRVTESGVLMALTTNGITVDERYQLKNLARLASYCFDTEFDEVGILEENATLKVDAIPLEAIVDGSTIEVSDGKIRLALTVADDVGY